LRHGPAERNRRPGTQHPNLSENPKVHRPRRAPQGR
jgi:hypothetical protein